MLKITKTSSRSAKIALLRSVLIVLVGIVLAARFLRGDYYAVFLCVLTLALFNIPLIVDRTFNLKLPSLLEMIVLLFVFAAEILGEIASFYTYIPWWDTMLHTVNGFIMAAIGFALIDLLNNSPKFHFSLSPVFVAFVAFCFSMTVGVVWEFFEYGMDILAHTDMQKDRLITSVSSVLLNPSGVNEAVKFSDITETVVRYMKDGEMTEEVIRGGYLDIGIIDTMKDLIVNCIGAAVFSVIGYLYILGRNKSQLAKKFIPQLKTDEEIAETKRVIEQERAARKKRRHSRHKRIRK
ncbi:MAG: hypothetical protein IJC71_01335 [Clostridia bacterium]|nr:hypothetical protein [Clostridia bacterium]